MKYKVGQKVRIVADHVFVRHIEDRIRGLRTGRVVTIRKLLPEERHNYRRPIGLYMLKEIPFCKWEESWLIELPLNRFELMDI